MFRRALLVLATYYFCRLLMRVAVTLCVTDGAPPVPLIVSV
jgi:predicted metal-dependent hydrolase